MMRIFISLIISCCIAWSVSAQNDFETTMRYGFFTHSNKILPLDNGEMIIVGNRYESDNLTNIPQLDKLDASNNLVWTKTYPEYAYFRLWHAVVATDNSIYLYFEKAECDLLGGAIVLKLDNDGNIQWVQEIEAPHTYYDMTANANGGFWGTLTNSLLEYDGNYDTIQSIPLSDRILDFDYDIVSGDIVVWTNSGDLTYIGANGDTQQKYLSLARDIHFWGDYILVHYHNKIERYNKQLNLINSTEPQSLQYPVFDFDDTHIYLSTSRSLDNISDRILKLNENLEVVGYITWQYGRIRDIDIVDDYLYVLGDEYTHTYLKTIDKDFDYISTNTDIGIVDILVTAADSICLPPQNCPSCSYNARGIKVVVKNFGTETINYLEINALYSNPCSVICPASQSATVTHDNLNIAQGDVDTLNFPDLNIWNQYSNADLCLYTTRPNKLIDKDHNNDEICRNFFYNDITAVEPSEGHFEFSISPNPASDVILLKNTQVDWKKVTVNIISIDGKQIATQQFPQIDIRALSAGVYVVQCKYGGATGSKRFVKYK